MDNKVDLNYKLPTCACGYNKNHPHVHAKAEYSIMGHFLVTFGITYKPVKVRYFCLKCKTYFDETMDPKVLNHFV